MSVCGMNGEDTHFIWYDEISPMNWAAWSKLLYRGKKFQVDNMNSNVEDLIQASKDQNGRVYQKLREQEKEIANLGHERRRLDSHICPVISFFTATSEQMFNALVSRIGTKGILKMLAER